MKTRLIFTLIISLSATLFYTSSCKKRDVADTDPGLRLSFSSDTIFFDTVFSTIGSITQRLIVFNNHDQAVEVSSIMLAGGAQSNYRINIDGDSSLAVGNVKIAANDSLYIFVRVTIDPGQQNLPFLVTDSILFQLNGNIQQVQLEAWGQDARFLKNALLEGTHLWDSLKPYVIYGHIRLDTGALLEIDPGTKVYFHKDAYLAVSYQASIKAAGTLEHKIWFLNDRLDSYYKDLPGQWAGIYLEAGSGNHEFDHVIIKNGHYGIQIDEPGSVGSPMLRLTNTIIQNMTRDGLFAYGTTIESVNCVIANCGGSSVWVEKGGTYDFKQLTIGNYWGYSVRTAPALMIRNYSYDTTGTQIPGPLTGSFFGNSIIYGADADELVLDRMDGVPFELLFDHALLRTTADISDPALYLDCMANEDPLFVDPAFNNLRIDSLSPAIDAGTDMGVWFDIEGVDRGVTPDLGAYEWVPLR